MSDKLMVVSGKNVELEVFEEVYGQCSDVVYVILVKVGDERWKGF